MRKVLVYKVTIKNYDENDEGLAQDFKQEADAQISRMLFNTEEIEASEISEHEVP
jgi:hypothetical protein